MSHRMPHARRTLTTALWLAVAGAGCGSVAADDGSNPDVDPDDTAAPVVASTEPAASATGVREDEKIHVTFSEPMDQASVEAAYTSADLPAAEAAFEWSPDGKVLTITPASPLQYADGMGTDPTVVTAKTYTITIGTGATDLAGNPLAEPMELSFATRRRLLALFGLDLDLTRVTLASNSYAATEIFVGDDMNMSTYRSYLTFDLSTLPADAEVEQAQFQGRQLLAEGMPYAMGPVNVQHLTYTSTAATVLNSTLTISVPGTLSADATQEIKKVDVTSQVIDDVAHRMERADRSQYRLQINKATNEDPVTDRATFGKNTFVLGAIYTVE